MSEKKSKVLVVEDDESLWLLLKYELEHENFEARLAMDGAEALRIMEDYTPDIILCDIVMPGLGGFEFRELVRNWTRYKMTPFIFLTARTEMYNKIKGYQQEVDDYITKPFEMEPLTAKMQVMIKKREQSFHLGLVDSLTGLFNRKGIEKKLEDELKRVLRYSSPLSVMLIDVDYFKNINDSHGHQTGDEVLHSIGVQINQHLRDTDFAGRIGSEEFLVIMPNTDKKAALFAAERIRKSTEQMAVGDNKINVTISAGLASSPDDTMVMTKLVEYADKALYSAKNSGCNQVVTYDLISA